jgi:multisubunit Na+/H+ antiporter MnhG subunit
MNGLTGRDVVTIALLVLACAICALSALGQWKARDALGRLHLGGPVNTVAPALVAAALCAGEGVDVELRVYGVAGAVLAFVLAGVSAHVLGRAQHHRAHPHQQRQRERA